MQGIHNKAGNVAIPWLGFSSDLRASLKLSGKAASAGAMLLVSGCLPDAPIGHGTNPSQKQYEDKGSGVFLIDQGKLLGNAEAIAAAFAQWKIDHPHTKLKEVVQIGSEGKGAVLLLTEDFFSKDLR